MMDAKQGKKEYRIAAYGRVATDEQLCGKTTADGRRDGVQTPYNVMNDAWNTDKEAKRYEAYIY
jgi:hypothetical protein